jgi:DNA-binding response OmpR family regulator
MKNILVIDDTEDLRSLIAAILTSYGFNVREAESGQSGVRMINEEKPDLVVCDIHMPGMDGYDTLAAVRNSPVTAGTPFILMTGLVSNEGARRGQVLGEENYLVKPFSMEQLVERVQSRLQETEVLASSN